MLRRLLPTLMAIGCGLLALGWGLVSLQRMFAEETETFRTQLRSYREEIALRAADALRQKLRQKLEERLDAIREASGDPLLPANEFYFYFREKQFLPRLARPKKSVLTPARDLYAGLLQRLSEPSAPGPWQERLDLLRAIEAALSRNEQERAGQLLETLLRQRANERLPASQEIPFTLLVAERLARGKGVLQPVRELVRGWLPEELGGREQGAGLQRDLLRERGDFTQADFDFLSERILKLSAALGEPSEAFQARAQEVSPGKLVRPESLAEPTLLGEFWYLVPVPEGVVGIYVKPRELLEEITQEMRQRGRLTEKDQVLLGPNGWAQPVSSLKLEAVLPDKALEEAQLNQRYRLKTLLVAICGALAVAIAALAGLAQHRKYRFLELKSDFVATVSHELRTPLASIRLLAETLELRTGGSPEVRDYPARIIQAADGLHFLVENILSFNRIDKGRWSPQLTQVRLEELIGTLRSDLSGASRVPVQLTADVEDVELWADPSLLRLLLSNLGRNACAYNHRNPVELTVRVHVTPGNGCTVLFGDNGIGIPEGEWENVFQDFYRLTPPGPEVHGSGLGLALCRRIMHVHGGQIRVAASGPQGTTFALTFPEPR